jgi:D-methionine transport system substrate-binding protein
MKTLQSSLPTKANRRFFLTAASSFTLSLLFASCSNGQTAEQKQVIKVGVTWTIAEDVLKYVRDNLARQAGLEVQIVNLNDWVLPNTSLRDGAIDANFFEHRVFMEKAAKELNIPLVALNPVFKVSLGLFSKNLKSLDEIPQNATVTIANDDINRDQGLRLLEANGLIKLKPDVGEFATVRDIIENPKNLQIKEVEGVQTVRSINDVDFISSTADTVAQAGIKPNLLGKEEDLGDKYALALVTLRDKENDQKIQTLNKLMNDPKLKDFINQKYQGRVKPVF